MLRAWLIAHAWVAVSFSFFARTPHNNASNNADKKPESTTSWEKYEGLRTNQPTKVHIYIQICLIRDFSTLTREICHGPSRPDPHETRTSRVTRSVAGRVGSGRVGSGGSKSHGSGRVGSRGFKISRIAAPADRSTAPSVGLLPEAAQLGCLPGPETA